MGSPLNNSRKLKILCLHGYSQNGAIFREKTGAMRKAVHRWADFHFLTAPHCLEGVHEEGAMEGGREEFGWWQRREGHNFCFGIKESLECIHREFEAHGPFDGLLGFSQGASMVSILCYLNFLRQDSKFAGVSLGDYLEASAQSMTPAALVPSNFAQYDLIRFKFVIFFAGFEPRVYKAQNLYPNRGFQIPSLHVYGLTDAIIPPVMSTSLVESFVAPFVVTHPGGHFVPGNARIRNDLRLYFEKMYNSEWCFQQ